MLLRLLAFVVLLSLSALPATAQEQPLKDQLQQPVQEPAQPLHEPLQPMQEPAQTLQAPLEPTQEPAQTLQAPLQPAQEPAQTLQEPLQPTQEPAQTLQEPTQPVPEPAQAAGEQAQPKRASYLPAKDNYDVFVLGDLLAGGLYAGMERVTVGDREIKVRGRFKEDSGIARPEFYDWNDAIPKILESNKVDIAVILIGTNDAQAMTDGVERLEFGTPQWTALYSREVDRLINTVKQGGAAVYWVSLPPMAAPSYNASISQIAEIQKRQAEAASVRYIDVRGQLTEPDGKMMVRGPDDTGDMRKLRDNDGIRFMKVGNNKLGKMVLDVLRAEINLARNAPLATDEVAAPIIEDATGKQETGRLLPNWMPADGGFPAESGKSDAAGDGKTDFALRGAITQPPVETPASRLFKLGEAPPPVAGRFDDFSFTE